MSLERVTNDRAPEFNPRVGPDGRTLLFHTVDRSKSGTEAYSVAAVAMGQGGRDLLAGPNAWGATWTPDGSIIYVYGGAGRPLLVSTTYAGAGMTYVSPSAMGSFDTAPDVSPTGERIAFQTSVGGITRICTVGITGRPFTVYAEGTNPSWHPSANKLAFSKQVGPFSQVFALNLSSGQVTQVTTGDHDSSLPDWSPDGEGIVFASNRDGGMWHIFTMKSDGSSVTQLTHGAAEAGWPHWSDDGWIYFASNAGAPRPTDRDPTNWSFSNIWRAKPAAT
ncbi:MAG: hypothetical protein DHS20C21_06410 [Gemmatimonadota bacterium]|nr:MAG: hypothetical protein DHS20C21_06410 [Gemmatimonadota bacterium]